MPKILGVNVADVTMEEAVADIAAQKKRVVFTPNAEMIMSAYRDKGFGAVLNQADLLIPDGIGVVYAARIIKKPLRERVAGIDLMERMLEHAAQAGRSVFLLGGQPGVALRAAQNLAKRWPGLRVAGTEHGYFADTDITEKINNTYADYLFVCMGSPRQEQWIHTNLHKLNQGFIMGAGGSLDIFAGDLKRAPLIFRRLNLEWFYRLCAQPARFTRILKLPHFIFTVMIKGESSC